MSEPRYEHPQAFRQAITDRLRLVASRNPGTQSSDLLRLFAYDRLLGRLFTMEPQGWVLKGATALIARLGPTVRHTLDVDLYGRHEAIEAAEAALRKAASVDAGDFFRFVLGPGRRTATEMSVLRIPVVAYLGVPEFAGFHVDLVTELAMTGEADVAGPIVWLDLPDLVEVKYRVYPIADHLADKECALLEVHTRLGGPSMPSTRYRDMADLAIFAHRLRIDAYSAWFALASEAQRRSLVLPEVLPTPTAPGWRAGYARVARDVPSLPERDLDAALSTVRKLIHPILDRTAVGSWDPDATVWSA
jgi:hypothetical protein